MTLSTEVTGEIRRLHHAEGWPVGTIAHQLGVHRDAVKRVLDMHTPTGPRRSHPRLLDPYMTFVAEALNQYPRLRATRLYDMLRPRGYTGSVRTLRDYVARVRPRPTASAYLRLQPLRGEQAQIDWAHVGKVQIDGGQRALGLCNGAVVFSCALDRIDPRTAASLRRSLICAIQFFGGTPRQWLFDNPMCSLCSEVDHPFATKLTTGVFKTPLAERQRRGC